jgi:multiple sugar transport system ATP-binding protein
MSSIRLNKVSKMYRGGVVAVDEVSLTIDDGEFMVLVGPSGCGKTTILRMIAGLEEVTEGDVFLGDRDVTDLDPQARDVAMVFQNYALFPHMTVAQNIGFGLRLRHTPRKTRDARVLETAKLLGLDGLLDRRPAELSGGQRQRVAIGRALVREPSAFLMDEPLSNLDAKLRGAMRAELARLHRELGTTTVYVTHDQSEAMTLGQRVAVLRNGVLQQCAAPRMLFERPANLFVAAFIGSPSMNLVEVTIDGGVANLGGDRLALHPAHRLSSSTLPRILGIRPSDFVVADRSTPRHWPRLRVRVETVEDLGAEHHLMFRVAAPRARTDATKDAADGDDEATILREEGTSVMTARLSGPPRTSIGDTVSLTVDNATFHLFDVETGEVLASPVAHEEHPADEALDPPVDTGGRIAEAKLP